MSETGRKTAFTVGAPRRGHNGKAHTTLCFCRGPQGAAIEEEPTGEVELDAPGVIGTDMAADPADGVPAAELLLLTVGGIAASPGAEVGASGVAAGLGADGTAGPLATTMGACEDPAAPPSGRSGLM
jgi:hypothetical protein